MEPSVLDEDLVVKLPRNKGAGNEQAFDVGLERLLVETRRKRVRVNLHPEFLQMSRVRMEANKDKSEIVLDLFCPRWGLDHE